MLHFTYTVCVFCQA